MEPALQQWITAQRVEELCTSVITTFEVWDGLARLPDGHRRNRLARDRTSLLGPAFLGGGIFELTVGAAQIAGRLAGELYRAGQSIGMADCMIAGIALDAGATLATGNIRHLERIQGLSLINPWGSAPA